MPEPDPEPGPEPAPAPAAEPAAGRWLPWLQVVRGLLVAAVSATVVTLLWPATLGGRSMLVVVHGTSMLPQFQPGDLLYSKVSGQFAVGDIAIFRVPAGEPGEGQLVVHRVVGLDDDGRFIMEGDNRPNEDGLRPGPEDMVAHPLLNLGPWPLRLVKAVPWMLVSLVAVLLGRLLWPSTPPAGEAPGGAVR